MKVAELKQILDANKITYPKKAKKEDLVQLVKNIIQELNPKKKAVKKVEVIQPYVAPQKDTLVTFSYPERVSKKYVEPLPEQSPWETYTDKKGERHVGLVDEAEFERARIRREKIALQEAEAVARKAERERITEREAADRLHSLELDLSQHPIGVEQLKGIVSGFLTEEEALRRAEAGIEPPRVKIGAMTPVVTQKRTQDLQDRLLLEQVKVDKKPIPALPPRPKSRVAFGKTTTPTVPALLPPRIPVSPDNILLPDVPSPRQNATEDVRQSSKEREPRPQRRQSEENLVRSELISAVGGRDVSVSRASTRRGSYGRAPSHDAQQERLREIVRRASIERPESIARASLSRPDPVYDPVVVNQEKIAEFKSDDEPSHPPKNLDLVPLLSMIYKIENPSPKPLPEPSPRDSSSLSRSSSRGRSTPRPSPPPSPRAPQHPNPIVPLDQHISMTSKPLIPTALPPPYAVSQAELQRKTEEDEARYQAALKAQAEKWNPDFYRGPTETPQRTEADYDKYLAATLATKIPSQSVERSQSFDSRSAEYQKQMEKQLKAQQEKEASIALEMARMESERSPSRSQSRSQSRGSRSRRRFGSTREESLEPLQEGTAEEESDIPHYEILANIRKLDDDVLKKEAEDAEEARKAKKAKKGPIPRSKSVTQAAKLRELETESEPDYMTALKALNQETSRTAEILRKSQDSVKSVKARRSISQDLISKPETELELVKELQQGAKERIAEEKKLVDKVLNKPIPKTREGKKALIAEIEATKKEMEKIHGKEEKIAESTKQILEKVQSQETRPRPKPSVSKFSGPVPQAPSRPKPSVRKVPVAEPVAEPPEPPQAPSRPKPVKKGTKTIAFTYPIPQEVLTKPKETPKPKARKPTERKLEADDEDIYVEPSMVKPFIPKSYKTSKAVEKLKEREAKALAKSLEERRQMEEKARQKFMEQMEAINEKAKKQEEEQARKAEAEAERKRLKKEEIKANVERMRLERERQEKIDEKMRRIKEKISGNKVLSPEDSKKQLQTTKSLLSRFGSLGRAKTPERQESPPREELFSSVGAVSQPSRLGERLARSKTPNRPSSLTRPSSLKRAEERPPTPPSVEDELEQYMDDLLQRDLTKYDKKQTDTLETLTNEFKGLYRKVEIAKKPETKEKYLKLVRAKYQELKQLENAVTKNKGQTL